MKAWTSPLAALSLGVFVVLAASAFASQENIPVLKRAQPEYDAVGARAGGLMLYPSVQILESFDSNVYAARSNTTSDFITQIQPGLLVDTVDKKRGFKAALRADYGIYKNLSRENFSDYKAVLNPYWELTHNWAVKADLSWEKEHEQRNDPDALQNNASREPVTYERTAAVVGATFKPGLMTFGLYGERAYVDFDNGQSLGGAALINDDRNRFENAVIADIRCEVTDRASVYWTSQWLNRDYKRPDFVANSYSGDKRDSGGYQSVFGFRMPVTPLINIDAHAGYRHQNFNDTDYKDIGTAIGKATLTWMVTPLTAIDFNAQRDVFETNQTGASGYVQSHGSAIISHELRRNIVLNAEGGMGTNNYIGFDRDDDYWTASAGAIYKMNRNVHWQLHYAYEDRRSTITAAEYDKHRVILSTKVQF